MPQRPGIYRITNSASGKVYIGSSAHMPRRLYIHRRMLGLGRHDNIHLQRAWNNEAAAFVFEELEAVQETAAILVREQYWIDHYMALGVAYNIAATAGNRAGVPQPASVAEKMRAVHKGKPKSAETRAKMSAAAKGRRNTSEQNEKIRSAVQQRFLDPDERAKTAEYAKMAGPHSITPATRAKMMATRKSAGIARGADGAFKKRDP